MGNQVYHKKWLYYYDTATSFVVDGESYLFGQSSYSNRWFIQDLPKGQMGDQTDDGKWEFYYDTAAPFYVNGRTFLFLQKKSTGYWNIMEVLPGGIMGNQIGEDGHWHHYYNFVFPIVVDSDYLSTDNWMTDNFDLIRARKLHDIAIPGSHDAGMSKHQHCELGNACNTQTQVSDIADQLERGARYLDLRPVYLNDSEWFTGHVGHTVGLDYAGCMGQTLASTLEDIMAYLLLMKAKYGHHKELVILNFSHCYGLYNNPPLYYSGEACNDQEWSEVIDLSWEMLNLSGFMLDVPQECQPPRSCTYEQLMQGGEKGNVIFLVDTDSIKTDYSKGIINVDQFDIYNEYSNTNSFTDMRDDQYEKLRNPENHEDQQFLLSWTLTLSNDQAAKCLLLGTHKTILDLAVEADNHLMAYINKWVTEGDITKTLFPNILYVDRFGSFATRAAIYLNKHYADLQP